MNVVNPLKKNKKKTIFVFHLHYCFIVLSSELDLLVCSVWYDVISVAISEENILKSDGLFEVMKGPNLVCQ